jgi:transcription elongation factor/antiterminator RfaH
VDGSFGIGSSRRWYAVRAQPRKEQLAEDQLLRQGFRAFLPKVPKVVRRPTRTETISTPFFPGYLFVRLDLNVDRWRSVNSTFGVLNIVSFGDRPAPAPEGMIEDLVALAADNGEVRFDQTFNKGDEVRVIGGPLNGHVGRFEAVGPQERVYILLRLLSQETRVEVAKSAIMAA